MDETNRAKLIDACEAAFAEEGIDLYNGAKWLLSQVADYQPLVEAAQTREGLDTFLGRISYADDEKLGQIAELALAMPKLMTAFVEEAVRGAALHIPDAPRGRKRLVTPDVKRQLIASVGKLNQEGVTLGLAVRRVAQKTGFGVRTVQRAWQERAKTQPISTLIEAYEFVQGL